MGLDMYLHRRNDSDSGYEEIGYWSKFNDLHGLIVEMTDPDDDNCTEMDLTTEQLEDILHQLKVVQGILDNATLAPDAENYLVYDEETSAKVCEFLPATPGCFIGSYYIDKWYKECIDDAVETFERALKMSQNGDEIYYWAWY